MENEIVTVCCNIVLRIDIEKCVNCTGFSSGLKKRGIIPKWLAFACQTPTVARYQSAKKHQPRKTQLGIRHVFPIWTAHRRVCFEDGVVEKLSGKPVMLEVRMKDADLYSFIFR